MRSFKSSLLKSSQKRKLRTTPLQKPDWALTLSQNQSFYSSRVERRLGIRQYLDNEKPVLVNCQFLKVWSTGFMVILKSTHIMDVLGFKSSFSGILCYVLPILSHLKNIVQYLENLFLNDELQVFKYCTLKFEIVSSSFSMY